MNEKQILPIKRPAWIYPIPVVVVGTKWDQRINWTTIAYVGIVDSEHLSLSMATKRYGLKLLKKSRQLSINIPGKQHMKLVDTLGLVSGNDQNKSDMVPYFLGALSQAPLIEDFPINIACHVIDIRSYSEGHELVICKAEALYGYHDDLADNQLPVSNIKPLLFSWDGYYVAEETVGTPWKEGNRL